MAARLPEKLEELCNVEEITVREKALEARTRELLQNKQAMIQAIQKLQDSIDINRQMTNLCNIDSRHFKTIFYHCLSISVISAIC